MKNLGYYNGRLDEIENISVPMTDRVCFFGDGIYDAAYSRNYKIFTLDEHIDRFFNSAALLKINLSISKSELRDLLNELVRKMDTGENFVYFQATRGSKGNREHCFDENEKANLWVNIYPRNVADVYKKVKLITMEDTRFLHCNIKTLNLIPAVLASQAAKDKGCDEAVFHRNGRVTECAHSNVHILKDGALITAPCDNLILPGIARRHIINACNRLDIPVIEKTYTLSELMEADEVMISSAGSFCLQAESIDGVPVGNKASVLLKKLQNELLDEFLRETDN